MSRNISSKIIKRSIIMLFVFSLVGVVIAISLFKLQILNYKNYQNQVIEQMTVETSVNPSRGAILDRKGKILASNKTVWVIYLMPQNIQKPEFIAKGISEILNEDYEVILNKAKKTGYKYQVIDKKVSEDEATKIRKFIDEYSLTEEIKLVASTERYYPYNDLASHTIGFVNADGVGIYGLEKVYNNILEGTSGKYITAQNAQSGDMPFQYEKYIENENGYNLVTTLDLYIQHQLEAQLELASIEAGAKNRAAGIVMNPKTGEIYAMAVYPYFDLNEPYMLDSASQAILNEYEKGTNEYKKEYLNLLYGMWNNKAVTELYEPGSTFKLFTTSVALQEDVASIRNSFTCTGSLKIDGFYRAISCHKRTGHGTLSFAEALQQSCNPSMMNLAFRIGKDKFYQYFQKFGYTSKTNIDLPSEASSYYHKYVDFSNVSLAVYSFGQTFKTTPIQQLRAISVVANGGYLVTPHFLKEIVDNAGNVVYKHEQVLGDKVIDTEVCKTISQILKEGVDGAGGAKNAYVSGYSIAAKTGTSEKKDKFDENGITSYRVSSCVAYAPSEDAQVAVIILVDEPSVGSAYGSVVAAPYVSNLMELILPYLGIKASYSEDDLEHQQIVIPGLVDMKKQEAIKLIKDLGVEFEVIGNGEKVISQVPCKNSTIYKKTGKIILYTDDKDITHSIVPNIIGKSAEEANKILSNAGFNINIIGSNNFAFGQGAIVVNQFPIADTYYQKGEVVTIEMLFTDERE